MSINSKVIKSFESDIMQSITDLQSQVNALLIHLDRPLVLVGMMGAGKSTVGRTLSAYLGIDFFDSDNLIERTEGRSINDIFAIEGEAYFRECESDIITSTLQNAQTSVIATGGGALTTPKTLDVLVKQTHMIWLKADIRVIASRLKNTNDRPLLDVDDPKAVLSDLFDAREEGYARAHIHMDTHNKNGEEIAIEIIKSLFEITQSDRV